jgi:hypothetical protein
MSIANSLSQFHTSLKEKGFITARNSIFGMLYINSYLDRIGALIRDETDISEAYTLTEPESILEMFKSDCTEILKLYKTGTASYEDAKRNLSLLKSYVVTQLGEHFEKVKEIANSKGLSITHSLDPGVINEIALYIDLVEKGLEADKDKKN